MRRTIHFFRTVWDADQDIIILARYATDAF